MLLIPVAFIVMLLGIWVVQHERTIAVVGIIVSYPTSLPGELLLNFCKICYLGLLAYLISRIVILCGARTAGKDMMLFFAFVSVVLTSGTILCTVICIKNFDRGFKVINQSKNGYAQESYSIPTGYSLAEPPRSFSRPSSRLTLD